MARLTIVNGPYKRTKLGLVAADVIIGREPGCDLLLEQAWVSRRHCRLFRVDNAWWIEDLGSRNGVYVNGVRVTGSVRLSSADLIAVGPVVLCFEETPADPVTGLVDMSSAGGSLAAITQPLPEDAAEASPAAGTGTGSEPIRVALAPDLRFAVVLTAALESRESITQDGRVTLRSLARRGTLAADGKFDGRLSGRFSRTQFLTLDSYDITGRASYALRVGLLLPKRGARRRCQWVEAYVRYNVEHTVAVRRAVGRGVLDTSPSQVELGPAVPTISAAEGSPDPASTHLLLAHAKASGGQLPFDVPYEKLLAKLTDLAQACVAAEQRGGAEADGLTGLLKLRCLAAAELYRTWYREQWQKRATRHDSTLPLGQITYEFDAQGNPLDLPRASTVGSVYRWV